MSYVTSPWVIVVAVLVLFVLIPIAFRLVLKLFEPGIDDEPRIRLSLFHRQKENTGEWGRDDAGLIASSKNPHMLPHQRRRGAGRWR